MSREKSDHEKQVQIQIIQEQNEQGRKKLLKEYSDYLKKQLDDEKINVAQMNQWIAETKNTPPKLTFSNSADVDAFFNKLAVDHVPFKAIEVDTSGVPTGSYKFSSGDGVCYEGHLSPETMAALMKCGNHFQKDPILNVKLNDALKTGNEGEIKSLIKQVKEPQLSAPHDTAENDDQPDYSSPHP